jgi:hypothetical protein
MTIRSMHLRRGLHGVASAIWSPAFNLEVIEREGGSAGYGAVLLLGAYREHPSLFRARTAFAADSIREGWSLPLVILEVIRLIRIPDKMSLETNLGDPTGQRKKR